MLTPGISTGMERHEHAFAGTVLRGAREQVAPLERDRPCCHPVAVAPGDDAGERAFSGPVDPWMAWTSPGRIVREMPRRIGLSPKLACRSRISSMCSCLPVRDESRLESVVAYPTDPSRLAEQFLGFDGELHRKFAEDFFAEAAHDQVHRVLGRQTALTQVEDLVVADLGDRRFVFDCAPRCCESRGPRKRVRAALVADEQRVALRVVARGRRVPPDSHQAPVVFWPWPAEIPFDTIVLREFLPRWIIFVPVSACW